MTTKVGVFGASGRMGATVCGMAVDDRDLELVAAVDPHHAGLDIRQALGIDVPGLMVSPDTDGLEQTGVEVMVDFTVLQAARREHSRKPDEQYRIIESCSPGPYLELFGRGVRPGWVTWGDQADDSYEPAWKTYAHNSASESAKPMVESIRI